jgi:2-keto-4-pentenoate hydratase/2-oxohepta-3-ene-1,7-dioic acid hydratase in catechol pathway
VQYLSEVRNDAIERIEELNMKFVTYRVPGGAPRAGIAKDGRVFDLAAGAAALGYELPADIVSLLRGGEASLAVARTVEANGVAGLIPGWAEDEVRLGPALPAPPAIFLLAANYQSHIVEGGGEPFDKSVVTPLPFLKPATAVIGTGDEIRTPSVSDTVDYEIEIAAVIGKRGREIPVEETEAHVAGYVVFNDISARELKTAAGRKDRPGDPFFDWLLGKWCDSFAAIGPYLVTRDEAGDPKALEMSLKVNGELRQHSSAGEMIFTIPEAIAFLSRFVTLEPGTLLCMGTPGGVGATTSTYLKPGDLVEGEIERLGKLVNRVS